MLPGAAILGKAHCAALDMKRRNAKVYCAYNKIDLVDVSILLRIVEPGRGTHAQQLETPQVTESLTSDSNAHCLPVGLAAVHRLPGLLDRSQHRVIRYSRLGSNERGLGLEVDVEGLDAYIHPALLAGGRPLGRET